MILIRLRRANLLDAFRIKTKRPILHVRGVTNPILLKRSSAARGHPLRCKTPIKMARSSGEVRAGELKEIGPVNGVI